MKRLAVIAGYIHIIGYCIYCLIVNVIYAVVVLLPLLVNLAVKMNLYSLIGYGYEPRSAAGQPVIGKLCLPAVL